MHSKYHWMKHLHQIPISCYFSWIQTILNYKLKFCLLSPFVDDTTINVVCFYHLTYNIIGWRVPLVEQELFTLPEYLSLCYLIFSFMCMLCRSMFVLLYFFFWPMFFLSFDVRLLIIPLVFSNLSSDNCLTIVWRHGLYVNIYNE
jgi:hypothetical protein